MLDTIWDKDTATAILDELRYMDSIHRIYGCNWSAFLDKLAIKYGVEPDNRPTLNFRVV